MAITRQNLIVKLNSLGYKVPNSVEMDGSISGATLWGNPSPFGETQFGNCIAIAIANGFNSISHDNGALPQQPRTAPVAEFGVPIYKLHSTGFEIINMTGNAAGNYASLGNDVDHYIFCEANGGPFTGVVPLRIGPIADPIDMEDTTLPTVTVSGGPANAIVQLGSPFVAIDGTRGFMLRILDTDTGDQYLAPVNYNLDPTVAIPAPHYTPYTAINDRAVWMPDYIDNTNRTFLLNPDGNAAITLFKFDVDLGAGTITCSEVAQVSLFGDLTTEESDIVFNTTYGPMIYMRGPVDDAMTWGICWRDCSGASTTMLMLSWDGTLLTYLSYEGYPFWPNGRFQSVFGPVGTFTSDSTEIEPPAIYPSIDGSSKPATHWFIRLPYVDPNGVGSGPWSFEDDLTWRVWGNLTTPPLFAQPGPSIPLPFCTQGDFNV